jgi:transaldolase (EC 2.2.1.2)
MKLFIDTANIDEIKEVNSWGVLSGVTTNPSLIAKEGRVFEEVVEEITKIVDGPISAEVISLEKRRHAKRGKGSFQKIHKNITIKVPMTKEGLKAVSILSKRGT